MAKDIILNQKPLAVEIPLHYRIASHIQLNSTLEGMKKHIQNATTVESAVKILKEKFGLCYSLFICRAIRECFGPVPYDEITRYLTE